MQNNYIYALLISVGDYENMDIVNLSTYKMDLAFIASALNSGLKVSEENIRMIGHESDGFVATTDLARAINNFKSKLTSEDTFFLYFSRHGRSGNLIFSDGQVELQSVINFIEQLPVKNKVIILDCCYAGRFKASAVKEMHFDETIGDFVGHGTAIFASSSADEVSRLGPNGDHSMFTGALSTAILKNRKIRKGRLSLDDIVDEMQWLVNAWNWHYPDKQQQPIFRSRLGGTLYFNVEEYEPYQQMEFHKETEQYKIVSVKPLSSSKIKRLSAFVIIKKERELLDLADIAKEISENIKYAEIYSSESSEERFEGTPARAVWCYFGKDESDIINHLHYAYTIWCSDEEMKQTYFRANKHAIVSDGIYIYENTAYQMLKKMQQPTMTRDAFIEETRKMLALIVSMAEHFIADMQEVANKTLNIRDMQARYSDWIRRIRTRYIKLSDGDVAPDDLHDWAEEIMSLAGYIVDMGLLLENERGNGDIGERELWLIKNSVKKYHESLEKLKDLDRTVN